MHFIQSKSSFPPVWTISVQFISSSRINGIFMWIHFICGSTNNYYCGCCCCSPIAVADCLSSLWLMAIALLFGAPRIHWIKIAHFFLSRPVVVDHLLCINMTMTNYVCLCISHQSNEQVNFFSSTPHFVFLCLRAIEWKCMSEWNPNEMLKIESLNVSELGL